MSDNIYEWSFSDEKNRWLTWYIIAISIVIWLFLWWIFTKQYGFSFIIIFLFWVFLFIENNSNDIIKVEINENWLNIDESFYDYNKIEKFETIYDWENIFFLRLILKKRGIKNLDLRIDNNTYKEVKNILEEFIWEAQNWELSKTEKIINILKL